MTRKVLATQQWHSGSLFFQEVAALFETGSVPNPVGSTVVDCLVGKAVLAIQKTGAERLCVGGGVAANRRFRLRLQEQAAEQGFELHIARPELCTDNAVMGAIAIERLKAGLTESLELDIQPGLVRG